MGKETTSFTMSFDASKKLKKGDAGRWLMHAARDVDMRNGVQHRHSNPNINSDYTENNMTFVYDSGEDDYICCTNKGQVMEALEKRLSTVAKPLRKDAVIARPLILQLDPFWYAEHDSEEEKEKSYDDMMEWAVGRFGRKNIICVSLHEDEASPHMHLLFTPVTEDGRLSQKEWFSSPESLREMHRELREHMRGLGYDIDMENRKPGKYAKRMPEGEYRSFAELQRKDAALRFRIKQNYENSRKIEEEERLLRERERAFKEKQEAYKQECHRRDVMLQKRMREEAEQKAELARREAAVAKREAAAAKGLAEAGERLREAARREAAVAKREEAQRQKEQQQRPQKEQPRYSDRKRQVEATERLMQMGVPVISYYEFPASGSRMPDFPC